MGTMQVPTISVRMCMLGIGSVGKSALTLQFMYDEFVEDYEPTKSSAYKRKVNIEDICVEVDITDTAGQEDYAGINDPFYRNNDGFIVVFSLTDKESLKAVPLILERIVQCRGDEQSPVVLVGNKVDLVDERAVPAESAIQLAQKWQIPYLETSARTRHNLEEAYMILIRELVRLKLAQRQPTEQVASTRNSCCVLL
ncbi:Ras- protein Ral-a [Clonorchis sinensis]|uniref:Ras- protein Ral-a n=1 Tax=Clonorchis sinensis TaxID=79923 RepID=A0A8T1MP25_CLOSI|nr:Ras- protein Ral-a [Clonorchis sinensis]